MFLARTEIVFTGSFYIATVCMGTALAAPVASRALGLAYMRLNRSHLRRLARGRLVLTYDDGPSPRATGQLLELLNRYNCKATFFLLGSRAERFPGDCDILMKSGHELATHSYAHVNAWKVSGRNAMRDYDRGVSSLSRWVAPSSLFRPPHGKVTALTLCLLKRRQTGVVGWTVDTKDTHASLPQIEDVVSQVRRDGGGVVLMHCHHTAEERIEYVNRMSEALICEAGRQGWEICTVGELLSSGPGG